MNNPESANSGNDVRMAFHVLDSISIAESYAGLLFWPSWIFDGTNIGTSYEVEKRIDLICRALPVMRERLDAKLSEEDVSDRMLNRMRASWKRAHFRLVQDLMNEVRFWINLLAMSWGYASPIGSAWKVHCAGKLEFSAPSYAKIDVEQDSDTLFEAVLSQATDVVNQAQDIVNAHGVGRGHSRYMLMVRIELLADILVVLSEQSDYASSKVFGSFIGLRMQRRKRRVCCHVIEDLLDELQNTLRRLNKHLAADPDVPPVDSDS